VTPIVVGALVKPTGPNPRQEAIELHSVLDFECISPFELTVRWAAITVNAPPPAAEDLPSVRGVRSPIQHQPVHRRRRAGGAQPRPVADACREAVIDLKPRTQPDLRRQGPFAPTPKRAGRAPQFVALMNTLRLAQVAGANVNPDVSGGQGPYANAREPGRAQLAQQERSQTGRQPTRPQVAARAHRPERPQRPDGPGKC